MLMSGATPPLSREGHAKAARHQMAGPPIAKLPISVAAPQAKTSSRPSSDRSARSPV